MTNKNRLLEEFKEHQGELVLSFFTVYQLIGIAEDENDYYYVLYDGRTLKLESAVGGITHLKGNLRDGDYKDTVGLAKLNYYSYKPTLRKVHIKTLTEGWDNGTRLVTDLQWELI